MALHRERQETMAYRLYVTESLRLIPQGKYITQSFSDALKPSSGKDADGDAIVREVIERAGLVVR